MNKEFLRSRLKQAIEIFGVDTVTEVVELVKISDADGAYTLFEDEGMFEEAECLSYMYFEE